MNFYDPALMMLQQAKWAFDNWIRATGTVGEYRWEGLYEHFLAECDEYEENENALRGSAGQLFIKRLEKLKGPNHLTRISQ